MSSSGRPAGDNVDIEEGTLCVCGGGGTINRLAGHPDLNSGDSSGPIQTRDPRCFCPNDGG